MAKKQSKSGGNRKHGSNEDYCKLYTAAGLQEKNGKRRVRRHLLNHPTDSQAITVFERAWGFASDIRVVELKQSTNRTMTARAARKAARKLDTELHIHLRAQRDARRHSRRIAAEKSAEQAKQQHKQTVVTVV